MRDGLFQDTQAKLLDPAIWRDLTAQPSWSLHRWGEFQTRTHRHWRHPQTLILKLNQIEIEMIGTHLKSKINRKKAFDDQGQLQAGYIEEAMNARVKLTTEAFDIRRYIERRFEQTPSPQIFVCGDMNDGPGRKFFEREFLFFFLISNLQGDVFSAQRFLNHALFDFEGELRWSTQFNDKLETWSRTLPQAQALPSEPVDSRRFQLLDHILFT